MVGTWTERNDRSCFSQACGALPTRVPRECARGMTKALAVGGHVLSDDALDRARRILTGEINSDVRVGARFARAASVLSGANAGQRRSLRPDRLAFRLPFRNARIRMLRGQKPTRSPLDSDCRLGDICPMKVGTSRSAGSVRIPRSFRREKNLIEEGYK